MTNSEGNETFNEVEFFDLELENSCELLSFRLSRFTLIMAQLFGSYELERRTVTFQLLKRGFFS